MKPEIGTEIYIAIHDDEGDGIYKETVGYLGSDSFIIEDYATARPSFGKVPYDGYGKAWFLSYEEAEKYMKKKYGVKEFEVVRKGMYWEGVWEQ